MYSAVVLEHFANPYNRGVLPDADAMGQDGIPGQGPYMVISLRLDQVVRKTGGEVGSEGSEESTISEDAVIEEAVIEEAVIEAARFETYGCPAVIASGNWLTQWVVGKTPAMAAIIEAHDLLLVLGGLPLGKRHAAELAVNALRDALRRLKPHLSRPREVGEVETATAFLSPESEMSLPLGEQNKPA